MTSKEDGLLRLLRHLGTLEADSAAGSAAGLAKALGVSVSTIRSWLTELGWRGLVRRVARGNGFVYVLVKADAVPSPQPGPPQSPPAAVPAPRLPPRANADGPSGGATARNNLLEDPRRRRVDGRLGADAPIAFDPSDLDHMVVSPPLAELLAALENRRPGDDLTIRRFDVRPFDRVSVIIDLNLNYTGGLQRARHRVYDLLVRVGYVGRPAESADTTPPAGPPVVQSPTAMLDAVAPLQFREISGQYVFALLTPAQIRMLVMLERRRVPAKRAVYRLWPDHIVETQALPIGALSTIKADAARATFGCAGFQIVWAVVDSGIDGAHPHFEKHRNLRDLPPGINHCDLVSPDKPEPLVDRFGHGTHVAGIIAGAYNDSQDSPNPVGAARQIVFERNQSDDEVARELPLARASGVAPECSLVSFKVLGDQGQGPTTGVIAALEEIYRANGYGKATRIHGVNLSVGYPFEPRWFACGHSPLCEVVDRLVRSGVVVVIAAGNNGYALTDLGSAGVWGQGRGMSITDPGNAELAITVGSTHREAPHTYGVSYFSSKGPTGDGRSKPDLLAPGENIVSCASGSVAGRTPGAPLYKEDSGTSMAAPHVSGAIAAFLSVRREFVGKAEAVKTLFLDSALDLKRHRDMQGHGLLDLLRALQSV